jgi:hypothetical protein
LPAIVCLLDTNQPPFELNCVIVDDIRETPPKTFDAGKTSPNHTNEVTVLSPSVIPSEVLRSLQRSFDYAQDKLRRGIFGFERAGSLRCVACGDFGRDDK